MNIKNFLVTLSLIILMPAISGATNTTRDYLLQFTNKAQDTESKRISAIRIIEEKDSPMVCVQIAFKHGGFAYDGEHKGIAEFMSRIFGEGYEGISTLEYRKKLDQHGTSISYHITADNMVISLYTVPEELEFGLNTISSVLTKPKLNETTIEQVRGEMLADLNYKITNDPEAVAHDVIRKKLFPAHEYGNIPLGTIDSIKGIDANDLRVRVRNTIVTNDAVVSAAGNFDSDKLPGLIDKVFLTHIPPAPETPFEELTIIKPAFSSDISQVTVNSGKTVVAFAQKAYSVHDAKYPAYSVLISWLGRPDLDSLLMRRAREVGLSYRIRMDANEYTHSNFTYGYTIVEPHKEEAVIHLINDTISAVSSREPKYSQLEAAKAHELSKLAFSLSSAEDRASYLMKSLLNDLAIADILMQYDALTDVTESDVLDVAKTIFDPHKISAVVIS